MWVSHCFVLLVTYKRVRFPSLLGGEWAGWDGVCNVPALLLNICWLHGLTGLGPAVLSPNFYLDSLLPLPCCLCSAQLGLQSHSPHACSLPSCAAHLVFLSLYRVWDLSMVQNAQIPRFCPLCAMSSVCPSGWLVLNPGGTRVAAMLITVSPWKPLSILLRDLCEDFSRRENRGS